MTDKCSLCDSPANWVRVTQFSGSHYYCEYHAEEEPDFHEEDDSYHYWSKVEDVKTE